MNGYELMDESAKWWGPTSYRYLLRDSRAGRNLLHYQPASAGISGGVHVETGDVNDLRAAFADFHADVRAVLDACPAV